MGYIIDTDVCIDFLKGKDFAIELFSELLSKEDAFLSILTYYELLKGAYNQKEQTNIDNFVALFKILNLNENIIVTASGYYRKYRAKGMILSDVDCLIMATAKEHKLKIVTRNVKHYPEVELLSEFSKSLMKDK